MAVMDHDPVLSFEDWYKSYEINEKDGCIRRYQLSDCASSLEQKYNWYKREMDQRMERGELLELLADGQVISPKDDLPNVSSGETAGIVRRMARNLVQNAPNVEVISKFDDDSVPGVIAQFILKSKIIGSDQYSNDMQQHLFASAMTALTLGFACTVPALTQDRSGSWMVQYDSIHYRDVFPEPGAKDVRRATSVFVRRYLTKGEVKNIIRNNVPGWDHNALRELLKSGRPNSYELQSTSLQDKKKGFIPEGYEVITWYSDSGDPFLTYCARTKLLLRIEKNKHPQHEHPVHFLTLEHDDQHPLGKSIVELLMGRQDFQDLMLNGAMKLWYRNINPSIIGFGANAVPNLGPGKYTQITNPNAKIEAFEVNTQTLLQYGAISQQNLGSMVTLVGSADQQMAVQAGNGMSATPQGVEAQQAMVDITTNNYQKAIESFFSHYCSYALTTYFQELKSVRKLSPSADARKQLLELGLPPETFNENGDLEYDFKELAVDYWVRCVPGSLVEMEDEKQLRVLNELFVPLSQAMPALAATQDPQMITTAARTMQFIVQKQIELSGSKSAAELKILLSGGDPAEVKQREQGIDQLESGMGAPSLDSEIEAAMSASAILQLQEQVSMLAENQRILLSRLGVTNESSTETTSPESDNAPAYTA